MEQSLGLEINNLVVCRKGFGEIIFLGKTKMDNLDLRKCIRIDKYLVEVYPNTKEEPPIGTGLNKPAIVTLHNIYPPNKSSKAIYVLLKKLKSKTTMMGAKFIKYNHKTGSWSFMVKHFSKYGLSDSDEELEIVDVADAKKQTDPKTLALLNQRNVLGEKNKDLRSKDETEKEKMDVEKESDSAILANDTASQSLLLESSDQDLLNTSMPSEIMDDSINALVDSQVYAGMSSVMNGLDSVKIQSMKSSLFHEDNFDIPIDYVEDLNILGLKKPQPFNKQSISLPVISQEVQNRKSQKLELSMADELIDHYKIMPSAMPQKSWEKLGITGSITSMSHLGKLVDFKNSILFRKQHMIADSGLFMGKSFRIGWGSNMRLLHQGNLGEKSSKFDLSNFRLTTLSEKPKLTSNFCLNVSKLETTAQQDNTNLFVENLVKNLEVQLRNKSIVVENEAPLLTSNYGVKLLHEHSSLAEDEALNLALNLPFLTDVKHMWDLCVALWGNLPLGNSGDTNTYNLRYDRKTAFSKWLMDATKSKLLQETQNTTFNSDGYLNVLFSLLTGHQMAEACNLAVQKGDYRLSLILGNATSILNRAYIEKQLENWQEIKAHDFIDKNRLKIYALLAGCLIWNLDPDVSVNCCENLDWKRVLAVHLWYHCPPAADIRDAVVEFEKSFSGTSMHGKYAQPPYPTYIENDPELLMAMFVEELETSSDSQSKPYDVCYHLLKLYCDRSMRLDRLLSTQSYTLSHLDYGTSWFLYQVLITLGYDHLPLPQTHQLHNNFASQLETLGLWEWSIFVLLHISNPVYRKKAVIEYLTRHISFSKDEEYLAKESFIIEKLGLPKQWIFSTKAILARSLNSYKDEAWCLLKSGNWNQSHRIIIQHIAPDCIINDNFKYLKGFLSELSEPNIASTILEWPNGGEVCLDYIRVSEAVDSVLKGRVKAYDLEDLQPQLVSLSKRICNLQCTNAKETLCQSEMAKKTATLLRAVLMLQKAKNNGQPSEHLLAPYLSKLPMPEDYALQELRTMTRAYRLELSSK